MSQYDATGAFKSTTVYGLGIDEVIARGINGGEWPLPDRNGNTAYVTGNLAGNNVAILKEYYRYDAFGTPAIFNSAGTPLASSAIGNRFLFTGREYNSLFSFYEYRARAYHPGLGRFMSEDPKGFDAGDYNLYRYCKNDPWDLTDPMGLAPVSVSSQVDNKSVEVAFSILDVSYRNSDGAGVGLERAKTVGTKGSKVEVSKGTGVGKGIPFGKQTTQPPDPPAGTKLASVVHNHTHNIRTNANGKYSSTGTLTSEGDRNGADITGKPIYTIAKDGARTVVERYRPSDSAQERHDNKGGATEERQSDGKWKPIKNY